MKQRKIRLAGAVAAATALSTMTLFSGTLLAAPAPSSITVQEPQIENLDPQAFGPQALLDQGVLFEGLVGYNAKGQIVPKMATHWTHSANGLVWTFYLRKNARWSNGAPVTAQDFYYSWMRMFSPAAPTTVSWYSPMQFVLNGYNYLSGAAKASQVGLKVVNPYEFQVTLAKPEPDFLGWTLLASAMPLYPPDVTKHATNWYTPKYFVGNGPYVVSSYVAGGQIVLTKNPKYVGPTGQFNVGNIHTIKVVPASTVPVEDFLNHSANAVMVTTPSDYKYATSNATLKHDVHFTPAYEVDALAYDKSLTASPLNQYDVRRAIAMSINRLPIANSVLSGMWGPAFAFGPPSWPAAKYEHALPYNVKLARKLLAQAGHPNGKGIPTLTIYTPPVGTLQVSMAESVAAQLKANLNIHCVIHTMAASPYGYLQYGPLQRGIKPGFMIFQGQAVWAKAAAMDMQSINSTWFDMPTSYLDALAQRSIPTYDPFSIKAYGNPTNTSLGITAASWKPLNAGAKAMIKGMNQYIAKQTNPVYKASLIPNPSFQTSWNQFVSAWKAAKTPATKHLAWVNAWKFVSNEDLYLWEDQHRGPLATHWQILDAEEAASNLKQAAYWGGHIGQAVIQDAYWTPLVYPKLVSLVDPNLKNITPSPWVWPGFAQLQYATLH